MNLNNITFLENVVKATVYITSYQKEHKFIPDFLITKISNELNLSNLEVIMIRNIVQSKELEFIWK